MSEIETSYHNYKVLENKYRYIDGEKYYRVIWKEMILINTEADNIATVLLPREFDIKENDILSDELGNRFIVVVSHVYYKFSEIIPKWYLEANMCALKCIDDNYLGDFLISKNEEG